MEPLQLNSGGGALHMQRLGFYFLAQIIPAYRRHYFTNLYIHSQKLLSVRCNYSLKTISMREKR